MGGAGKEGVGVSKNKKKRGREMAMRETKKEWYRNQEIWKSREMGDQAK